MSLKTLLKSFNRKERSWLLRDALGPPCELLDRDFIARVTAQAKRVDPDFEFDDAPYWAIDFHIDWLVGVLHRLAHPDAAEGAPHSNDHKWVTGSQEDIDLVIATGDTLLLIEAKGVGSWSNAQIASKVARLKSMTGNLIDENGYAGPIRMIFLLCSPRDEPPKLEVGDAPRWMLAGGRFLHFRLRSPTVPLLAVSRCDETGLQKATTTHWKIRTVSPGEMQDEAAPAET